MNRKSLNILTWNATGIMSSAAYLIGCLNEINIDICGIAEHWLYEKDLAFLSQLDKNYTSCAVSDGDLKRPSNRRVGKGGVAFLWHIKHDNYVSPILFDDDRVIGIKYEINPDNFVYFIQTYLPCSNHSINLYKEYVDRLQNIVSLYSEKGTVIIMGDVNTHLSRAGHQERLNNRSMYFNKLLLDNNLLSVNTQAWCRGADSTFVTYDGRHESLIDHIILPVEKLHYVSFCEIKDDSALNVSRHRPVHCLLEIPSDFPHMPGVQVDNTKINWRKVNPDSINSYIHELENSEHIRSRILENEIESQHSIDGAYEALVCATTVAARKCFPVKSFKHFLKPYWNQELANFHKRMKLKRAAWINDGKPRDVGRDSYKDYKSAKREFRRCHRKGVNKYLRDQIEEIDKAAELDSTLFWRLVNAKRKNSNSRPGSELIFNGRHCNTSAEINEGWANYFAELYYPSEAAHFDEEFSDTIQSEMQNVRRDLETSPTLGDLPIISNNEVESALKLTKRNKAGGGDGLVYEHLVYGGPFLCSILTKFFNAVIKLAYAPKDMKRGVITTLFKGGNKRKDNPDNYRAITLSSVILKVLERILLTRIELFDSIQPPLHPLQGGFRKQIGCTMTSFLVREALYFAKENGSKVYACYLDVRKAFDQVWHDGMFYKLAKCGINKSILKVLMNLYTDMESCVRTQSHISHWFPVLQGTRQGGVISPFLFLITTNDLLWELDRCGFGMCVLNIKCGSPAVADDLLLMSLSKFGLDQMLNICYNNSCKWHIEYQPPKCTVVVYNESESEYRRSNRVWKLGEAVLEESTSYKHLGVHCDKFLSLDENITSASTKLKGTLLSLSNCGLHEDGLNPLTAKYLYKSIIFPKALYGCELWNNLSPKQLSMLELAHRFCAKYIQSLPKRTNTDFVMTLLDYNGIVYEIEYRKLIFFRQLCCLPTDYTVKDIFLHRLLNFDNQISYQRGFIPDIHRILGKYSLLPVLQLFLENGSFMSKTSWKSLINEKIRELCAAERSQKIQVCPNLNQIIYLRGVDKDYIIWSICKQFPNYLTLAYKAVRMLGSMCSAQWFHNCYLCGDFILSETVHLLLYCTKLNQFRDALWQKLLTRFGIDYFIVLMSHSPERQIELLFSGSRGILNEEKDIIDCIKIFLMSLSKIPSKTNIII